MKQRLPGQAARAERAIAAARVLVIEDNPGDVDLVREALDADDRPWEVDAVSRLAEGLAALLSRPPAVVLLDLTLPDAAGLEGVVQLVRAAPDVPLVVLTGVSDTASGTLAVREGAQDYLVKGELEGRALARVLRYAIERNAHAQRARLLAREQAARGVAEKAQHLAELLVDASTAVASTLDEREALLRLARVLVPRFAETSIVERLDTSGCTRRLVVFEGKGDEPQGVDSESSEASAAEALRASCTRGPRIEEPLPAADGRFDAEARSLLEPLRCRIVVPLRVRGETLGTLALGMSRPCDSGDLVFTEEIAHRAAGAIDSARLYAQALEAVQIRDNFLSTAGHELRTPLGSILLDLELLARANCPEHLRGRLERISRCAERLHRLVDDLLDVSRIRAGRFLLDLADVELVGLVQEVADRLIPTIARSGSNIRLVAPSRVHGRWDGSRIEQVVANLLQNAARYGAGKQIDVVVETRGANASLRVRDHGRGIDPRDHARIFEQFSRAPTAKTEGLGLGLWIARGIIEAHGGSISVESSIGAGAEFRVELPCSGPPPANGVVGGKP